MLENSQIKFCLLDKITKDVVFFGWLASLYLCHYNILLLIRGNSVIIVLVVDEFKKI